MYIIGLTGGIATGKSNVSNVLRQAGVKVWDADEEAREVVRPFVEGWYAIKEHFDDKFFNDDNTLRRRDLAEFIFNNKKELKKLNSLLHPIILKNMNYCLDVWKNEGESIAVIDASLLFESSIDKYCDEVWVVSCGKDEQIRRIITRDDLSAEDAMKRIDAQMPDSLRRLKANRIIDTMQSKSKTQEFVRTLIEEIYEEL